ncbi:MAG: sulfatase-like hydrolase/transferase [Opitutales bacterium]|nr:sulfatase-like hydrolase/transferase [Opitutales bacterium]
MNTILITSDHLRWDYLSRHGGPVQTPCLDRLAARGTSFTRAYCQAPLCVPSRIALTTGRYPMNTGCFTNRHPVDPSAPTFIRQLSRAGIHTAMLGKLHHHVHAMDRDYALHAADVHQLGFKEVCETSGKQGSGSIHCECRYTAFLRGHGLLDRYRQWTGRWDGNLYPENTAEPWPWDPSLTQDAFIASTACTFLRAQPNDRPFYLHLGFVGPHPPFDAPSTFRNDLPQPPVHTLTNPDWWTAYAACVREVDHHIGSVLNVLQETGLADQTLIVYTSDHGEMVGEHGLWGKIVLYDPSVHVPLIVAGPVVARGTPDALVELIDLGVTICEAHGVAPHALDQGKSILPILRGERTSHRETVFAEMGSDKMLFDGRHKLLYGNLAKDTRTHWQQSPYNGPAFGRPVNLPPDRVSLFDLVDDPREERDLAEDPAHAGLLREMESKLLHRLIANTQAAPEDPGSVM